MCPPMLPSPIIPTRIAVLLESAWLDDPLMAVRVRSRVTVCQRAVIIGGRRGRSMSLRDHVICDSDLHVMEPPDLWERYIEPAYAHAAPRGLSEIPRDMRVKVKNHVMLRLGAVRPAATARPQSGRLAARSTTTCTPRPRRRGWDAQSQIDAMDAEGLVDGGAVPVAGPVRAGPRLRRAGGHRRARARVRDRDRARVQQLDEGLLRPSRRTACSARAWSRRTTCPARSTRRGAAWRSSASRRSSSRRPR